jgi:hypothetical protein
MAGAVAAAGVGTRSVLTVVVGVALSAVVVRYTAGGLARAAAGVAGEREVARQLRRARVEVVLFGVRPGRGRWDVDAVVLGPCLAAIEVKRCAGRVRVCGDGSVWVGGRQIPGRPLSQTVAGAVAIEEALEVAVTPILCLTGMRGRPRTYRLNDSDVIVCSSGHLRRILGRLEPVVAPDEARFLARELS